MVKISREIKTGVAVLLIALLFYFGFNFLKGINLFNGALTSYYTEYDNVNGLTKASPVTINGYQVGKVIDVSFSDDPKKKGKLVVQFTIEEEMSISKSSIAKIYSSSLMGGKSLAIIPSYEGPMAKPGDFIRGEIESDVLSSFGKKLNPLQAKVESVIVNVDSIASSINRILDERSVKNVKSSLQNLDAVLLNLRNASQLVENTLQENQTSITSTLNNVNATSKNLHKFSDSISKIKVVQLSRKIDATVANLQKITSDIEKGNGTLGKLSKDETLYLNLSAASKELEELLKEVKEHPKRFVHFSVFGKKDSEYQTTTK